MAVEQTVVDGEVVSEHFKPRTYTVEYAHTVNLGDYNNAKMRIFGQVDIDNDDDTDTIEAKVAAEREFVKALVLQGLGVAYEVVDGVVVVKEAAPAPAPAASRPAPRSNGGSKPPARSNGGGGGKPTQAEVNAVWEEWLENPSNFHDNRGKKADGTYKAGASDFVRKSDRFSLWIDGKYSTPESVKLLLNSEPF